MILLKAFLRKNNIKIYIRIFTILFSILFLLSVFTETIDKKINDFNLEHNLFLLYTEKDYEEIIKSEKSITSYKRAISFAKGEDNDIIYEPPVIITEYGTTEIIPELQDDTKLEWQSLIENDKIIAFNASSCEISLKDNEVLLAISENIDYKENPKSNYINKEINFKYLDKNINLEISDIKNINVSSYICISDNLYNELLPQEKQYIYEIKLNNYKDFETISKKWDTLEDSANIVLSRITKYGNTNESFRQEILEKINFILKILNIISSIVFIIITILTIKDQINDEKSNTMLLKQIGYNKIQNITNSLINAIVLDIIILLLSIIISSIIILFLSLLIKFEINLLYLKYFLPLLLFVLVIQSIFIISSLKNIK